MSTNWTTTCPTKRCNPMSKRVWWIDLSVGTTEEQLATIRRWRMTMYNTELLKKSKDGGWQCKLCNETMAKGLHRYSEESRERVRVHFKLAHNIDKNGKGW